jgi:hypothetical protein
MAGLGRFFGRFFGRTIGDAASFAIGGSISRTIDPVLQQVENEAWLTAVAANATRPVEMGDAAEIVAEDVQQQAWGEHQAAMGGYGKAQFDAIVQAVLNAPGVSELLQLWRRGLITQATFEHGLNKARMEARWTTPLEGLKAQLLDLPTLANAIQRGLINAPFDLPYDPTPGSGRIPAFPTVPIDATKAAAGLGYSVEQLKLETGLAGNPPGPEALYRALFRGAINDADVQRGLVEGRARAEWAPAFEADSRQIPTASEFVENAIRGYSTLDDAIAGGARHGMSAQDVTLIYQNAGRPLVPHQITTGLARGAKFNPIPGEIHDPYEASAHEASVKPSYQELYIAAGKYSYPPLFQLNQLVKSNAIPAATAEDWATKSGYAPEVIAALSTFWESEQTKSGGTTTKPKALTYSQIHASWRHNVFTDAQALSELEGIGYSAARAQTLLDTWKAQAAAGS